MTGCPCGSFCDQSILVCISGCANPGDCCTGTVCLGDECIIPECQLDADCTTAPRNRCEKGSYTCVECTADYQCSGSTCNEYTYTCDPKERGDTGDRCESDADCPIEGFCITEKDGDGNDTGYAGQQYHCYKECDPSWDPFCAGGEVCAPVGTTGVCDFGGTVGAGGDCRVEDCILGHICTGDETTGFKCMKGCDKDDNDPGCPFGERCNLLGGESRLGVCRRGT
ncbi:MAG: hypothetical protein HY897_21210 [Deltaproteobacteria bacterium]|nr:hypothetical protein [Deltaproteobacteria bacterium]